MHDRGQQVRVLRQQALRGQQVLESETAMLVAELERLYEARQALEWPEARPVAPTAGLLGNATRHRELLEARLVALLAEIGEAEARVEAQQTRLRQARQTVAGWERLAERLDLQERQRSARQEQEMIDQHGQWRSRRSG